MQIDIKKLDNCKVEIRAEVAWLDFEKYFTKALEQLSASVVLDGFRPGKASKDVILQRMSEEKVLFEAGNLCLQTEYPKIIQKNNLEPIGPPQVSILKLAKNNPFEFRIQVETLPEIILSDIEKIAKETEKKEAGVEEKDIEDALLFLQKSRATFEPLNRPAEKGDFVEIKYQSPALENNKEFQDKFMLGDGQLVKGFEDNLIGAMRGEEKKIALVFPADFLNKQLAGKGVEFNVKVEKVEKMILPDLTDGFAKTLGKFDNLEKLKESLKEGILRDKQEEIKQLWRKQVLEKISENTEVVLPETLLVLEKERLLKQFQKSQAKAEDIEKIAKQGIKNYLIINKIAKEKDISVFDKEAEETANLFLRNYPQSPDSGKNPVDPEKLKSYYKEKILEEKVLQYLENYAFNTNNY